MTEEIYEKLSAPFPVELIKWRVGAMTKDQSKGMALAYLTARDIMQRLDEVVGWQNWSTHDRKDGDTYYCGLSITTDEGNIVTKTGAAGATDIEGEKGGASDALKRAAVLFGIARYLYYLDSPWVELYNKKIKKTEYWKLDEALLGKPEEVDGLFDDAVKEYVESLTCADTLDKLRSVFDEAWRSSFSARDKQELKRVYDERKELLT